MIRAIATFLASLISANLIAACEDNVDKVQLFYVNGMFTPASAFVNNINALNKFQNTHMSGFRTYRAVTGSHNQDEETLEQAFEVARQKIEDISNNNPDPLALVLRKILNGDIESISDLRKQFVIEYFSDIAMLFLDSITEEEDYISAKRRLENLLRECPRVVLVGHSQGNFYGNALFNEILGTFVYPSGYRLRDFPMLGHMQIASPTNIPGGAAASVYPGLVGHITSSTDIAMLGVRLSIGSVSANYDSPVNVNDFSGHGLESSYLTPTGSAANIASQIDGIIRRMRPYPLHHQTQASSSALANFGYSSISGVLDIQFHNGSVYRYSGVSEGVYTSLANTSSQGGYFNANIRDIYAAEKLIN